MKGGINRILSLLCSRFVTLTKELAFYLKAGTVAESLREGIVYRGARRSEILLLRELYLSLNPGGTFSLFRAGLSFVTAPKLVVLAYSIEQKKLVGLDFFYFNKRDLEEHTVHEGFIGVSRDFEGRGIATQMRLLAKHHFEKAGLSGISSRISQANAASLASARKVGFEPVLLEPARVSDNEEYYLVCGLGSSK